MNILVDIRNFTVLYYSYPEGVYGVFMENNCSCCQNHQKHTPRSESQQKALNDRLNRIIGQLGGIKNMLADNRYCGDILIQLSAVQSALQSFGYIVLSDHLKSCVVENVLEGNLDILDETVNLVKKLK